MAMKRSPPLLLLSGGLRHHLLLAAHCKRPWQGRQPAFSSQKAPTLASTDHPRQDAWHNSHSDTWHTPRPSSHGYPPSVLPQANPLACASMSSQHDTCPKLTSPFLPQPHTKWQSPKLPRLVYPFNGSLCPPSSISPQARLDDDEIDDKNDNMALHEARRLLRLVQVEAVKRRLEMESHDIMPYVDLLKVCKSMGVASSLQDAAHFAKSLDDAGVILIFQDMVYLNPKEVAQLVINAIPKPLSTREQQSILQEVSRLEHEKEEIDNLAHKHSRRVLWSGLGYFTLQTTLIFRLTFWDLSWDVMEPIAYFVTTISLLVGYAFFMVTSKDPTYQDLGKFLLSSKQKKIMKKRNFDIGRLLELQKQCHPSTSTFVWQQTTHPFTLNS